MAIFMIYVVDFAINAVQASCRALIVDTLPISQQQQGSAWASRMIAAGNIVGYLAFVVLADLLRRLLTGRSGMIDLRAIFGNFLGNTQFKQLMVVSAFLLLLCVGITCYSVTERVLVVREDQGSGVLHIFATIWRTMFNLPKNIWAM
jgi:solute carrier family 45 protein 1/2/4